ncbi:MAG: VanW family protein [Acidimicrobiia bacterium]
MNKHLSFRIHPLLTAVIVVAGVFVMLFAAYGLTRNVYQNEVMGRVEVVGTPIGGLSQEEAVSAILAVEDEYRARTAAFTIDGKGVLLNPAEAGFDVDEEAVVDEAMRVGREGNAAYQFLWWLRNLFKTTGLGLSGSTETAAMNQVFDDWDSEVISIPVSLGAIEMTDGVPQPVYPETGVGVDREESTEIIEMSLLAEAPKDESLPTETIIPKLSDSDIDDALAEANRLLSGSIRMVHHDSDLVFTPAQLAEAYRSETVTSSPPQIVHLFDPETINGFLEPVRSEYEAPPVDARFAISGDSISIVPGIRGTRIEEAETAQRLLQAGFTSGRVGQLPLVEDADPKVTTESLENLGIKQLVSSFTTYYSCCQDRVNNIQLMADTVDMAIVRSGSEFDLNEYVGQRTEEKGYLPAGTIIGGQLKDTVGGGVSQFATTFYNAVFWGGYEDITHQPHSVYFSRYPEGIEATINWTTPNLIFRNNTAKAIMIDTKYTDTSITVRFFGDNEGRTVKGEQSGGDTKIWVPSKGGPDAIHIEGTVSARFAQTEPGPPKYIGNPAFDLDRVDQIQRERDGWSVKVTRRKLRGGTELIAEEEWIVKYRPQFAVLEVHPCKVPGQEETCPTTTTTIPLETTSTTS